MLAGRTALSASLLLLGGLAACGPHTGVVAGDRDIHCKDVTPVAIGACSGGGSMKAYLHDAAAGGMGEDFGATMYNADGDDDDCKYHVAWEADNVVKNKDVTFTVHATVLSTGAPMGKDAAPYIDASLTPEHPAPNSGQTSSSPKDGTFVIGPIRFDASGRWTVRFHFYGQCDDTASAAGASPHGHAAFYVQVP